MAQGRTHSPPRVRLVSWHRWCFWPYALLGLSLHSRVSDWLRGPYWLSSTGEPHQNCDTYLTRAAYAAYMGHVHSETSKAKHVKNVQMNAWLRRGLYPKPVNFAMVCKRLARRRRGQRIPTTPPPGCAMVPTAASLAFPCPPLCLLDYYYYYYYFIFLRIEIAPKSFFGFFLTGSTSSKRVLSFWFP
jgi:hypothetical protein